MNSKKEKHIAIISDGSTDREIFGRILQVIINVYQPRNSVSIIKLHRQNIRDHMEDYFTNLSNLTDYSLKSKNVNDFIDKIANTIFGAISDFESILGRNANNSDLIVLNTDTERYLFSPDEYFKNWALMAPKVVLAGIEKFYHIQSIKGYDFENQPLVLPLIIFPSTDILILAAKSKPGYSFNGFNRKAHDIKQEIYGVTDLRRLSNDELDKKALVYISKDGIKSIYNRIPEIRVFIQTLVWY
jgi:hypothetical protein